METVYKKKKLEYSVNECTSCTYTQNTFPIATNGKMKGVTSSPPLLVEGNYMRPSSASDINKNDVNPRYHYPHPVNHGSRDRNHYFKNNGNANDVSRERTCVSNRFVKSPPGKKLWSPELPSSSEQPPLLLKSCSTDPARTPEKYVREEQIIHRGIPHGSVNDKYRHPIFATTEDLKTDHGVISTNNWDKHTKPYGLDHRQYSMQCVPSRKNGSYMNSYSNNKSLLNKNIYIDCGADAELTNGDKERFRARETSPFRDGREENLHPLVRPNSRGEISSLLSTASYKSHSLISVSSREDVRSPEVTKGNDNVVSGRHSLPPNPMTLMNFGILEKNEQYIVVYAEINGKRYEGSLTIERKVT